MIPQIVYGVVLGIVQGITEFLPISSKGHLIILQQPLERWLGFEKTDRMQFDIVLHFGTLIALLIVYWRDLLRLNVRQWAAIVVGTIPIVIVGLLFHDKAESMFESPLLAGIGLLGTSCLLFVADRVSRDGQAALTLDEMTLPRALGIGLCQCAAIFPGLSRSGTTIAGGCFEGFQRDAAARFSFFLAIPAISGACVVTLAKFLKDPVLNNSPLALATGATVSLVVGLLSLQWLIRMISRGRLHWFAWYCLVVGVLVIVWQTAASPHPSTAPTPAIMK